MGEFANDGLQGLGVKEASCLREGAEGSAWCAEFFLNLVEATGLLDGAETGKSWIEERQKDQGGIVIEKEPSIAGVIAFGAYVVEAREEGLKLFEIFQPTNVVGLGFGLAWHDTTVVNRLSKWPKGTSVRHSW